MKKIFVTGATGAQGGAIAKVLKTKGYDVVSISQNAESKQNDFAKIMSGSLEDIDSIKAALEGSEAIILTLPLLFDSELVNSMTSNVVKAAEEIGVKRLIFNSSIPLGSTKTGYAAIDVKHDALEILDASNLDVTTLMPTIYLENLASPFLMPVIKEHSIIPYPLAIDFNFSWISQENLGRYCYAALNNDDLSGERILITNRGEIYGQELASKISVAFGKQLPYIPTTADEFQSNLQPVLGDYVAKEISNLYRGIDESREVFGRYTNPAFINSVELESIEKWALRNFGNQDTGITDINKVRENLDKWLAAFNSRDIDALFTLYDPESLYANSDSPIMKGVEQIKPWYENVFSNLKGTLLFKEEQIFQEERMALLVGKFYFKTPSNNTSEEAGATGRVALTYRRSDDGQWLLLFDMDNTPPDTSPEDFQ